MKDIYQDGIWVPCEKLSCGIEIKTNILSCTSCELHCIPRNFLIEIFLPKIETLDSKEVSMKKQLSLNSIGLRATGYCILKKKLLKECFAKKKFCKYNYICPYKFGNANKRLIRYNEVSMYAIKTKDKDNLEIIQKEKLYESMTSKEIQKIFKITHEIVLSLEVLPNNEQGEKIEKMLNIFIEKYTNKILLQTGEITTIQQFYKNGKIGEKAYIFAEELVPVKYLSVNKIHKGNENKNNLESKKTEEVPIKRKRGRPRKHDR